MMHQITISSVAIVFSSLLKGCTEPHHQHEHFYCAVHQAVSDFVMYRGFHGEKLIAKGSSIFGWLNQ